MNTATRPAPASCLKANIRTTALLALGVFASVAAVAGPQTDSAPVSRSAKVSLAGLDISTPEGARAARERLRETARRLCSQVADSLDLSHQPNYVACVDDTLTAALRKVTETGASTASAMAQPAVNATKNDQHAPVALDSRSAKVSLADLDLTTPEGASAVRERLHQAARRLCSQVADSLDLSHQHNYVACVDESLTKALRQTATPALVAGAPAASH